MWLGSEKRKYYLYEAGKREVCLLFCFVLIELIIVNLLLGAIRYLYGKKGKTEYTGETSLGI